MTSRNSSDLRERARRVRLVLMDVDGVLTNGLLYYLPDGAGGVAETKGFDSQDGMALRWLRDIGGIEVGWISGRQSIATIERARMLGVPYLYQNHLEKLGPYNEVLGKAAVREEQICYIGDDLTDAPVMLRVGLPVAPANARPEIKQLARYVTTVAGGSGAVREVVELLLRAQGKWDAVLEKYGLARTGAPARRKNRSGRAAGR